MPSTLPLPFCLGRGRRLLTSLFQLLSRSSLASRGWNVSWHPSGSLSEPKSLDASICKQLGLPYLGNSTRTASLPVRRLICRWLHTQFACLRGVAGWDPGGLARISWPRSRCSVCCCTHNDWDFVQHVRAPVFSLHHLSKPLQNGVTCRLFFSTCWTAATCLGVWF